MGVLSGCKPRDEVLKRELDDAIFAADFGNLIAGKAPQVYQDARTFFENTHPAKALCKVVSSVFERISNKKEGGVTIRLSTGFGGGKTHTLMTLWHLAQHIDDHSLGTDILPAAGRPSKVHVVAIDASKAGIPEFSRHDSLQIRSLWGEIFYQLGGGKAYQSLGDADDPEASPSESQIEAVFPKIPVLILLDEIVIYMAKLSDRGQGNLMGFLNSLMSVVSRRPQTALLITDPAGQTAYAQQSQQLAASLEQSAKKLDDMMARKMTDFDPIGDEAARVITRRLFENIVSASAQSASAVHHSLYQRVIRDYHEMLPPESGTPGYAKRIVDCYPFHPRLLDTTQDRLGALQDFQKSRGVLRLFARILRDVWERRDDVELITAGDIDWSSSRIQADLIQRLNRDNFKAAISADVDKHAGELDGDNPRGIHRRVASALLLESLPLQPHSGMTPMELTLAVLRPEDAGPEPSEALDRLVGVCWHTYPMAGGRGWQFRYEPNIIKQIEERKSHISPEDAKSQVLSEVQSYFGGPSFKLAAWPASPKQVPDSAALQLVLCEDEEMAKRVCNYADDSQPEAPIPRRFINAILAVTANRPALYAAIERAQRLMAADEIEREHKQEDSSKQLREQLRKIQPDLRKQFRIQTCRAFDRVVFAGGACHPIEEKYLGSEDEILQKPAGQKLLRTYLDEKGLIYQVNDSLDVDRFMKEVLPGATPLPDAPGVYTAKAIHERFLSAPGLRLLGEISLVRQTLLKALHEGQISIRLADGRAYDSQGCVEGPVGKRRRIQTPLHQVPLDDTVWITPANSETAREWLREDTIEKKPKTGDKDQPVPPPPPPPVTSGITVLDWDGVLKQAPQRPLLTLDLTARSPATAHALSTLAQPLGAETISLTVTVSGTLRDGGMLNFTMNHVKPTHPTKPLTLSQTFFNALQEGSTYEVSLSLDFGPAGRTGLEEPLKQLAEQAPDDLSVKAKFDKPIGG